LASIPGASNAFWGSFVCYTNDAKRKMLGVEEELLKKHGPVSRETALAMAKGALEKSGADIAVSITGLAGPEGDGSGKKVGTVFMGLASFKAGQLYFEDREYFFKGLRNEIRRAAAITALQLIKDFALGSIHIA